MPIFFSGAQPPGIQPFSSQKQLQHPTSGKWVVEMQLVDPAHLSQIAVGHWTRQILDTATAEAEKLRLAHDGYAELQHRLYRRFTVLDDRGD